MKTITHLFLIILFLLPFQMYSQLEKQGKTDLNLDELLKDRSESNTFNNQKASAEIFCKSSTNGYLLAERLWQDWNGSDWVNYRKDNYVYDDNDNLIENIQQKWDTFQWLNEHKYSYSYDENSNLIEEVLQNWDGTNWLNSEKKSFAYDASDNLIEELRQNWDGANWVNYTKIDYTYDETKLIEKLWQFFDSPNWEVVWKDTYSYDSNNLIELLWQFWDSSNWVNLVKENYTYDGNSNLIEELHQDWAGPNWVNNAKFDYSYDENNTQIQSLRFDWYVGSYWRNNTKYTLTYDGNNNLIESLSQRWASSNWVNDRKFTYSTILTEIDHWNNVPEYFSLSNNYPNPFNPATKITFTIPKRANLTLKVFDVLGSEVEELVKGDIEAGSYEINFDASELTSGIYFYRIQTEDFTQTKKMLLLK